MTAGGPGPLAVYVHVPYCRRICPYCDFNVHALAHAREDEDVRAFASEIALRAAALGWAGRTVDTVFFGGGTPSVFSAAAIDAVLQQIGRTFHLAAGAEVTLEANPGTVDRSSLADLRRAGMTRLSLGVQSFDDATLRRLGRDHSADEARRAVEAARTAGCDNVSLDVIYGVPGQDLTMLRDDLDEVCRLAPEHVSTYELTYEPGTPLTRWRDAARLTALSEDAVADMDALLTDRLAASGFRRYEISSHARPGWACRHNQHYWDGSSYLGIGPGAHSFAAGPLPGRRWSNLRDPLAYRRAVVAGTAPTDSEAPMDLARARADFVVTGLRRLAGVDALAFRHRFGVTLRAAFPVLATLTADGLVAQTPTGLRLTPLGLRFADTVNAALV